MTAEPQADPRAFLSHLFNTAVQAADPVKALAPFLPAPPKGRTIVIGAGKGSAQMAAALEDLWSEDLSGVVVTRYGYACPTRKIEVLEASHPVPDAAGLEASNRLKAAICDLSENDLVIALVSGGGSALLPAPANGLTLADEIAVNEALLRSGAPISEMNTVRKHISSIKGGRLSALTKAPVCSLIISDIPGDIAADVASGPTIPDNHTRDDALEIVARYRLALPDAVLAHLRSAKADAPRPDDPIFASDTHHIIASAKLSLFAAARACEAAGIRAHILSDAMQGEAREIAKAHAAIAKQIMLSGTPFARPCVLLSGGETTVSVRNQNGRGGRNGEFALSFAREIAGFNAIHLLAADTDGIDGSEDNAGAFADGQSVMRIQSAGKDCAALLYENCSHDAHRLAQDLFITGPTGTNVNDFRAILLL